ncbi:tubulin-specific chaperone E [Bradysia coprophila]|uniref:tubulin-specific chaperone E n=1 Tax=Bradysia coprophila TaxID=38358 RepID=UPI00187DA812|nr:tubulin-specific chaperone E [Bradysia coprophila]
MNEINFISCVLNCRVRVGNDVGTIKFIGELKHHSGLWYGIEWDDPNRGKHNGCVDGIQYFSCDEPLAGSMIRPEKVRRFETVRDAIENRYILTPIEDDLNFDDFQMVIGAPLMEFVGVEKTWKKQSDMKALTHVVLPDSNVNAPGDLTPLKNLSELVLSASLIWNWQTVGDIVKQIPSLNVLDLSKNRIKQPTSAEISELQPIFVFLKSLHLQNCKMKSWTDVLYVAQLWPFIDNLSLHGNEIVRLVEPDLTNIFKNLQSLDLSNNKISNFNEIVKLGKIETLRCLNVAGNGIKRIELPECRPDQQLSIFVNLVELILRDNPIEDKSFAFNELDKLPMLNNLSMSRKGADFKDMFSDGAARISRLKTLNNIRISDVDRRGAEYDLLKMYGPKMLLAKDELAKENLFRECRALSVIFKKYGSPDELLTPAPKVSNVINIEIQTIPFTKTVKKRLPRKITVQALQGIISKLFNPRGSEQPKLSYLDQKNPDIRVELDKVSKSLDYYSIQDGDVILVEW